jgi:FkbM family methyltransferase
MRVFMDVGAHYGETLEVALDPAWDFDRIFSFEPSSACRDLLLGFKDPRLRVVTKGLSDRTETCALYGGGLLGASVYSAKEQIDPTAMTKLETIELIRASEWLEHNVAGDDDVYLKLNCEGSEVDVLTDLLDTGAIARVHAVYVDFDIRKVPSEAHRRSEVEQRLREKGVRYSTPESVGARGKAGVARWLAANCPRVKPPLLSTIRYRLGLNRPPYLVAVSVATYLLPRSVLEGLARRFGRESTFRSAASKD